MNLDNQVAVVTGGASGMGNACAHWLGERGARVVIWDRDISPLHDGDCAAAIACDVSSEQEVGQALAKTIAQVGVPRIAINCAGIAPAKRMVGKDGPMPLADFKKVIDINLIGTFNVMRLVAAAMLDLAIDPASQERGVIINTASIAAYEGQIGQMAYSASKGGVVSMTLPAARELAQHAIRVNTIAPGLIATPMLLNMPQEVQDNLAATVTFPKRLGRPDEFARLAAHIIENELINGEVIRLDGALRMQAR
ncbi:SDR family NAD(P)-dependent oxidoreductase [Legionella spiritensis]|uniref:SDR family NAD(P)-dependent oxidoreductase n=1 Tax=Legionella spiritensis TaxID=452 RepID=UPI000F6CCDB7|nr:SDR family NAD(P)-dependent oxidoreductase [Legionella spiritensis]VEG90455.1 3-oxoacyl-ACP reductase [Legionella spiritensis]